MKLNLYNINGKKEERIEFKALDEGFKPSLDIVSRYIRVYLTNQRQGTVSTKDRTSITGGGKKPWKQKGTGRARAGSNRSPLWVGGAVALGPKPKDWNSKVTKNMKSNAFKSAISLKVKNDQMAVFDLENNFDKPATSAAAKIIGHIHGMDTVLVIHKNDNVQKSFRNIANVITRHVDSVNAYDIANSAYILVQKEALWTALK